MIFGYGELGASDRGLWADTAAWRQEVNGFPARPAADVLSAPPLA